MENFFDDDKYFSSIEDLIEDYFDGDEEQVKALEEGWTLKVELSELEPMFKLDANELDELLHNSNEERYSEDGDEGRKIKEALNECIDFEKLNSMIPKMYYPTNKFVTLTKQDLLDFIN